MSDETDIDDLHDRLQDILGGQKELTKAVLRQQPPVVNVAVPTAAAPQVRVESPAVNVNSPVTIEQPKKCEFHLVFERDDRTGLIKSPVKLIPFYP